MVNGVEVARELFIFNILGVYVSLVYSNLNFEEIYDVKYGFEISKEPVLLKESVSVGNTVLLSSKHGQQYQCILPDLESLEKKSEEDDVISKEEIVLLLEPLKKKCLYYIKGWWVYEVCFGKGIFQYHEEGNEIVGDKISLGFFSNETDWSQHKIEKAKKPKPGKSVIAKRFHSQYYVNGSECDLTGKARETQIKIYCDEGSADLVLSVDEPSSCTYVIIVHTNKLCKHGLFRSTFAQKPQPITCSPALSEERYKIYIERVESKKKAKAEAQAVKLRAQKARAAAREDEVEEEAEQDDLEDGLFARKKKRSKRSQVWPWENPGVESEDEVWIDGHIKDNQLDVNRFDITKGRKKNANGQHEDEGLTIMSSRMHRKREDRTKGDTEEKYQERMKEKNEIQENEQQKKTITTQQTKGDGASAEESQHVSTEDGKGQEMEQKTNTGKQKSEIPDDNDAEGEHDSMDEKWKKKMEEAVLELRSSLKDKLIQLGIKPEVLEQNFKGKPDSVTDQGVESKETSGVIPEVDIKKDDQKTDKLEEKESSAEKVEAEKLEHKDSSTQKVDADGRSVEQEADELVDEESTTQKPETDGKTIDLEADKYEDKESSAQKTEKAEKTVKTDPFLRSIADIEKILNEDMMKEIVDAAAQAQDEMERKFNEERDEMRRNVQEMRAKIKEIEDVEQRSGVKNEELRKTMNKIKASIDRFEKTNMELDEDMLSIKELNAEIFSAIRNKEDGVAKPDMLQLSFKTNRLLKKILLRRFQLEQEAQYIRKMSVKVASHEGSKDEKVDVDTPKDGIDKVINKLKTMIQDLDSRDDKEGVAEETTTEGGSSRSSEVKAGSSIDSGTGDLDQGDSSPGVKVRVSRIKKLLPTDDDDLDDESEMTETDLDAEEMEELNMEKRMRQATKKMEEMVKEQLRNSGVLPSGKIKVKVVTSREVLENMDKDDRKDVKLLSKKEETQFKDLILNLLGGNPEAGKEQKRQQDLESNYNLVWNDDRLQEVPREDDDGGEVEVESF